MITSKVGNIQSSWQKFLMDTELAKNYRIASMTGGLGGVPAPNPILEALLPSLLYIRLGALLDETFEEYINTNGLVMGKPYRNDFNGRITFLQDQGHLTNAANLHAIRTKRNELAHEASKTCTWGELDNAINLADVELQYLGLVGPRPKYEFYAERNPRDTAEPGYLATFDYCYGLKADGKKRIEISWSEHISKE